MTLACSTPVSEMMTTDVVCVSQDASVEQLGQLFIDRGISGAPVLDHQGRTVGIVSKTDLLRDHVERPQVGELLNPAMQTREGYRVGLEAGFHEEVESAITAEEIMMPVVFSISPSASVAQAAAIMAYERVHRLPVVTEAGEVVGILTSLDVLRWLARQEGFLGPAR